MALQLPLAPEQKAFVWPEFLIKPLMSLGLREHLFILTISQEEIRLLRATRFTVQRMDMGDMPESLA